MSMWEPFTERARRAIVLAQEEAQRLGNNYIGTEHILLGIIAEGENLAAKWMLSRNLTLRQVRFEVEAIVGRGGQTVQQEMVYTPRAKRALEMAFEVQKEMGHNYVGTEHLILGLIREGDGVAGRVLTNFGLCDIEQAKEELMALLAGSTKKPKQPPTSLSAILEEMVAELSMVHLTKPDRLIKDMQKGQIAEGLDRERAAERQLVAKYKAMIEDYVDAQLGD